MSRYLVVLIVSSVLIIQNGFSLRCEVCSPLKDARCEHPIEEECFSDERLPAEIKLMKQFYGQLCFTISTSTAVNGTSTVKGCTFNMSIIEIDSCQVARRAVNAEAAKQILPGEMFNFTCDVCETQLCNH